MLRHCWLVLAILFVLLTDMAPVSAAEPDTTIPTNVPWPIPVSIVVRVLDVQKISETAGELNAVVEYTSRWTDHRLAFDAVKEGREHLDLYGPPAVTRLNAIWNPGLTIENLVGNPRSAAHGLSIYANGTVVAVDTVDATFKVKTSMADFPFDTQRLPITFITPNYDRGQVVLGQTDADRMSSSVTARPTASQWHLQPLFFETTKVVGWNGQTFSRSTFWLPASRETLQFMMSCFFLNLSVMNPNLAWAKRDPFVFHVTRSVLRWGLPMLLLVIGLTLVTSAAL